MISRLLSTSLMFAAASSAFAQPMPGPMSSRMEGGYPPAGTQAFAEPSARTRAFTRLRARLRELRAQGLAMRAADGGTLTPEHRAFIQARLDSAQAAYRHYAAASR